MINLYRVVSQLEKDDFDKHGFFRTAKNTLEAKQFFRSIDAINEFLSSVLLRDYYPPYKYLFTINIDKQDLNNTPHDSRELDSYDAITIHEDNLLTFNNYIKFVKREAL